MLDFVKRVSKTEHIWFLSSSGDWMGVPSQMYKGLEVVLVWSDRAYALQYVRTCASEYEVASVSITAFLDTWLPALAKERKLIGTNWHTRLNGKEVPPLALKDTLAHDTFREEVRLYIGKSRQGTCIEAIHLPTQKRRRVDPIKSRLVFEVEEELIEQLRHDVMRK